MMERVYSRVQYLGRKKESQECKRSDQRIREGIPARYERCSETRMQGRNISKGRAAREIYGKEIIWVVG